MPSINFVNWRQRQTERALKLIVAQGALVTVTGVLMILLFAHIVAEKIKLQGQRNDFLLSKISQLDGNVKAISGVRDHKHELQKKLQVVSLLQVSRHRVPAVLNELAGVIPESVILERLDMVETNITVKGYSISKTGVAELIRNISISDTLRDERINQLTVNTQSNQHSKQSKFILHFSYVENTKRSAVNAKVNRPDVK